MECLANSVSIKNIPEGSSTVYLARETVRDFFTDNPPTGFMNDELSREVQRMIVFAHEVDRIATDLANLINDYSSGSAHFLGRNFFKKQTKYKFAGKQLYRLRFFLKRLLNNL